MDDPGRDAALTADPVRRRGEKILRLRVNTNDVQLRENVDNAVCTPADAWSVSDFIDVDLGCQIG